MAETSTSRPARRRASNGGPPATAAALSKVPGKTAKTATVTYTATLPPKPTLPKDFGEAVRDLEKALKMPVWMLIQQDRSDNLSYGVLRMFLDAREDLASDGHVALLIDSPGGLADVAYQVTRVLQRDGGFTAVIPRYAKSAATLMALGADETIMGLDAEIGPLDTQLWDEEREERGSALNEVQALDQLHEVALEHLDKTMYTMVVGTRKRTDVLLPMAASFVAEMMRPMLEKIDAVHYAKQSRILAVSEQYAVRLLAHRGTSEEDAKRIADVLVKRYPEHGFVIDRDEVQERQLLKLASPPGDVNEAVQRVDRALWDHTITAYGRLEEITA